MARGRPCAPALDVATSSHGAGARGLGTHARDCWAHCTRQHRHGRPQLFIRRPVPNSCRVCLMGTWLTAPTAEQVSPYILPPYAYPRLSSRLELISARWCLLPPAIVALLRGTRHTYEVFDWVWVAVSVLVVLRIGPRYLGRTSSSKVLISPVQVPS